MPIEKQDIQQMVAAASSYKFEDADRRAQYERLLADLNFIIKNNSINVIWDDVSLMEGITALLQEITALVKAQEIEDKEKRRTSGVFCPEWKNFSTWINQACWKQEFEIIRVKNGNRTNRLTISNIEQAIARNPELAD